MVCKRLTQSICARLLLYLPLKWRSFKRNAQQHCVTAPGLHRVGLYDDALFSSHGFLKVHVVHVQFLCFGVTVTA